MRVNVRFDNNHSLSKEYCYNADSRTEVGDVVLVPPNYWNDNPKLATVTSIPAAGKGYMGPTKWVERVYKDIYNLPAELPNYQKMLKDLESEADEIAKRGKEILFAINFIRERI